MMYRNLFSVHIYLFMLLMIVYSSITAQDKAFQIDFEKNSEFVDAIYSQKQGCWIVAQEISALKKKVEFKIIKYTPDFEKKEWEKSLTMGSWSGSPMYYAPNPSYIYFFDEKMGVTTMNKTKLGFQQISPTGDIKQRELVDEKGLKYTMMGFCDSLHFYHLGSTANPDNEFFLFKYAHDTWKHTKLTLKMPSAVGEIKQDAEWHLAGRMEQNLSFIRYGEKKAKGTYQVVTFDISSGKVVHQFVFKYDAEKPILVDSRNDRFKYGESLPSSDHSGDFCSETKLIERMTSKGYSIVYDEAALGNIYPSNDGKHYYFICSIIHKPSKVKLGPYHYEDTDGFLVMKLDQTGKVVWKHVHQYTQGESGGPKSEIDNHPGANVIALRQGFNKPDDIAVSYSFPETLGFIGVKNKRELSYLFDGTGKKLESYMSDSEVADKIISGKEKVSSTNVKHLTVAHRPKLSEAMKAYFLKKGLHGPYTVCESNNSAALFIRPDKTKNVVGVVYFKNLK